MVISLGTSRKILQQVISQLFSQEDLHSQEKRTCNFQGQVDSLIKKNKRIWFKLLLDKNILLI